jgi:hypothetical protein
LRRRFSRSSKEAASPLQRAVQFSGERFNPGKSAPSLVRFAEVKMKQFFRCHVCVLENDHRNFIVNGSGNKSTLAGV